MKKLSKPIELLQEDIKKLQDKYDALDESGIAAVYDYIDYNPVIDLQKASINTKKKVSVLFTGEKKYKAIPTVTPEKDKFDPYTGYALVVFKYLLDLCGYSLSNSKYERKYQEILGASYENAAIEVLERLGIDKDTFDEIAIKKDDIIKVELVSGREGIKETVDCDCVKDVEYGCCPECLVDEDTADEDDDYSEFDPKVLQEDLLHILNSEIDFLKSKYKDLDIEVVNTPSGIAIEGEYHGDPETEKQIKAYLETVLEILSLGK